MQQKIEDLIGQGGFGQVYKKTWQGQLVAVKSPFKHPDAIEDLQREITIHRECCHPNIVSFLGVEGESSPFVLIMELMAEGNLRTMLSNHPDPIPHDMLLSITLDIARGLAYLHDEMKLIHRDIKCENVLLDRRGTSIIAKICDLGFAVPLSNAPFNELWGTKEYFAPELCKKRAPFPYSTKSDAYAFALITWMLTSKNTPHKWGTSHSIFKRIVRGERENIPNNVPQDYAAIISDSWADKPEHRPSMLAIINRLTNITTSSRIAQRINALQKPSVPTQSQHMLNIDLYYAAARSNINDCQLRLDMGANPNYLMQDFFVNYPQSALMVAAKSGNPYICKLLLEYGADPSLETKPDNTADKYWPTAYQHKNPFTQLRTDLYRLAQLHPTLTEDRQEALLRLILNKNTSLIDWPLNIDGYKRTFLFYAFEFRQDKIITRLTADKRWPIWSKLTTSAGYTLLHLMAIIPDKRSVPLFKHLGEIDINHVGNALGESALHVAAQHGNSDVCQMLIEQGANLNLQNDLGNSALIIAAEKGHTLLCQLLLKYGADPALINKTGKTAEDIWCAQLPLEKNPFARFRRVQTLEQKKNQIIELLLNYKDTNKHNTNLYNQIALEDLHQQISHASLSETDDETKTADDALNPIINDWESKNYYYKVSKQLPFFQKSNDLGGVLHAIKALVKPEARIASTLSACIPGA